MKTLIYTLEYIAMLAMVCGAMFALGFAICLVAPNALVAVIVMIITALAFIYTFTCEYPRVMAIERELNGE